MPTNVTPEYKKAEEAYRQARDPTERLDCLKELLRTIPKHKGTEHLQADIKTRIKQLTEELSGPRKGGMLAHDDVQFQLVDLPPVSDEFMEPWLTNALQPADGALLVIDVNDPECVEQIPVVSERLEQKKIFLRSAWPGLVDGEPETGQADDLFCLELPTLLVANKCDLDPDPDEVKIVEELLGLDFPALTVSAKTGHGVEEIGPFLFRALDIVRVYTKSPGKPADTDRPFTVRRGGTVHDVAKLVHKDLARGLKFARMWGSEVFDGQQVGPDHLVTDGDIVELHL